MLSPLRACGGLRPRDRILLTSRCDGRSSCPGLGSELLEQLIAECGSAAVMAMRARTKSSLETRRPSHRRMSRASWSKSAAASGSSSTVNLLGGGTSAGVGDDALCVTVGGAPDWGGAAVASCRSRASVGVRIPGATPCADSPLCACQGRQAGQSLIRGVIDVSTDSRRGVSRYDRLVAPWAQGWGCARARS
jgi:hypothetical protein